MKGSDVAAQPPNPLLLMNQIVLSRTPQEIIYCDYQSEKIVLVFSAGKQILEVFVRI